MLVELLREAAFVRGLIPDRFEEFRGRLLTHMAREEAVLLPELAKRSGRAFKPLLTSLRHDHVSIIALIVPTPNPQWCEDLRELLMHHHRTEESPGGLLDLADCLPGTESKALLDKMRRVSPVEPEPHADGPKARQALSRSLKKLGLAPLR
jgi:hypothetical protein